MKIQAMVISVMLIVLAGCGQYEQPATPQKKSRKTITYSMVNAKQWLANQAPDSAQLQIAYAVNRTDSNFFATMDTVLMPDDMSGAMADYLPFPLQIDYLKEIDKVVFFSYGAQAFAAYEKGALVFTGQTNMGTKQMPTPTGLFYANWKAEKTISTVNDEWELLWNFNIENDEGIGWHQYELPGYPSSHSCLRLCEADAVFLYTWAEQWGLTDEHIVERKGTPVIVFGKYNFDAAKPWLQLTSNSKALDISEAEMERQTMPYLEEILMEQKKGAVIVANAENEH